MSAHTINIPDDLLQLKPSDALESVSMSKLARAGTAVLRKITASAQAVTVKVQGQGAMVTLSQHQYDEIVTLIQRLQAEKSDDGFTQALGQRFDDLIVKMGRPGSAEATNAVLFGDSVSLNQSYRPGVTESTD